ncbi:hypothetical protein M9Y10_030318 [Tritrichomonas musculus]|uniref:Uncharacterized protein n=1 Tax=Tritrichomonas musculus TaxID=1915356 RepID=A0ABR2KRM5_9EUKA
MKNKVILVGNSGVGKTSLISAFIGDYYNEEHLPTVNVSYCINEVVNNFNKKVKLEIWDTAGQEKYQAITKNFYRGANVALICFDYGDDLSKNSINKWIDAVLKESNECILYLVATKIDKLQDQIQLDNYLSDINERYEPISKVFVTSAKIKINVNELFLSVADENIKLMPIPDNPIQTTEKKDKKECC